jgi:transposase
VFHDLWVMDRLAVLPDRLKNTVVAWFTTIPAAIRAQITTVCTGIWDGYLTAVEEILPHTRIVIDRFHVARHYRDAVDTLRKQEVRRLKQELPKEIAAELQRTLWPFRKRSSDLDDAEQARLNRLLAFSPRLPQAYTFAKS